MPDVLLTREAYTQWGTFGRLYVRDFSCWTCERPWIENKKGISCIPIDVYPLKKAMHYGGDGIGGNPDYPCYEVCDVPGRSLIHVHIGNYASDVQGCIVLGGMPQWFAAKRTIGVPGSRATFERFMATMGDTERCLISIRNTQQGIL